VPFVAKTNKNTERVLKMNTNKLELFWHDIPTNKKEAVPYSVLQMWWNVNQREVRRILHELSSFDNGDDYVLIRSGQSKGFYKTDDKETIEAYKKECLNKGRSVFAPVKKINRILSANNNQYSLTNNLRVVRTDLGFTQAEVCEYMQRFDEAFDVPMLSKMENGVCLPTPFQLSKLSDFYSCDPKELVNADMYF
jgi:hypothetical protein